MSDCNSNIFSDILIIGDSCLGSDFEDNNCTHVVKENNELQIWNIKQIRNKIFNYEKIIFTENEEMNFNRGEDIFEKSKNYKRLYHFIGNNIKKCLSNL